MNDDFYILRLPEVLRARGRSKPSHYEDIRNGLFPHPVQLGGRAVGWPQGEVRAINQARIAGETEEQIRALVSQLEAMRKAAS